MESELASKGLGFIGVVGFIRFIRFIGLVGFMRFRVYLKGSGFRDDRV